MNDLEHDNDRLTSPVGRSLRIPYVEMLISSVLALVASLVLSIESVTLAANPAATFSCDVNALISCGRVAKAWQSSLLGFPNAFLGLICEPVVITIAVLGLSSVVLNRRFMQVAHFFYGVGFIFAWWLFAQSYFVIGALCPWCLLVTLTTTTVFASMTRINLLNGALPVPRRYQAAVSRVLALGLDHLAVAFTVCIVAAMVIAKYL